MYFLFDTMSHLVYSFSIVFYILLSKRKAVCRFIRWLINGTRVECLDEAQEFVPHFVTLCAILIRRVFYAVPA